MSEVQLAQLKGYVSAFGRDIQDSIGVLEDLIYYLTEYDSRRGELTKELITDQIEFNFEEFEEYIDGFVFFKDQLRKIIDGVINEDSRNSEIHAD